MKMGEDLINFGLSPRIDNYSFTHFEERVNNPAIIFQIIISFFSLNFGLPEGLYYLRIVASGLFFLALFGYYKAIKSPWTVVALTLPFITMFYFFRFGHVRPEIFSMVLVVVALTLCIRARNDFNHKNLFVIALLMVFWVNYHVAILGYVIFFGLFVDKAIDLVRKKERPGAVKLWLGWGVVLIVIGFANMELTHPLIETLKFSNEWQLIKEFEPTYAKLPDSAILTVFWLVSLYTVFALVKQNRIGMAIVCAIFTYQSWAVVRFLAISGIIVICLIALVLVSTETQKLFSNIKPSLRKFLWILGIGAVMTGTAFSTQRANVIHSMDNSSEFPVEIFSYLKQQYPQGGNIFNRYAEGGYLLYHLAPEFKIYIDGRLNILYPLDFTKRSRELLHYGRNSPGFASEVEKYDIKFALFPIEYAKAPLIDEALDLNVELVSDKFVLFSNEPSRLTYSSALMYFPMCWNSAFTDKILPELLQAERVLPKSSALLPVVAALAEKTGSTGLPENFRVESASDFGKDFYLRFAAYEALRLRQYKNAIERFEAISTKEAMDWLMIATAHMMQNNYQWAARTIEFALSEEGKKTISTPISQNDVIVLVTLVTRLEQNVSVSPVISSIAESNRKALLSNFPQLTFNVQLEDPAQLCQLIGPKVLLPDP